MENKDEYLSMRNALDSLRDVALAEIRLIENEEEKTEFADFMTGKVKNWLREIANARRDAWGKMINTKSKKLQEHEEALSANPEALCPPGFVEIDGICVPI